MRSFGYTTLSFNYSMELYKRNRAFFYVFLILEDHKSEARAEFILGLGAFWCILKCINNKNCFWMDMLILLVLGLILSEFVSFLIGIITRVTFKYHEKNFFSITTISLSISILGLMVGLLWLQSYMQVKNKSSLEDLTIETIITYILFVVTIWIDYFCVCRFVLVDQLEIKKISSFRAYAIKSCLVPIVTGIGVLNFLLQLKEPNSDMKILQQFGEYCICAITFMYPILDMFIYTNNEKRKQSRPNTRVKNSL